MLSLNNSKATDIASEVFLRIFRSYAESNTYNKLYTYVFQNLTMNNIRIGRI